MGMYDVISDSLFCPFCGKKQPANSFQTKDAENMLNTWSLEDVRKHFNIQRKYNYITIYSKCDNSDCHQWIELKIDLD